MTSIDWILFAVILILTAEIISHLVHMQAPV